MSQQLPEPPFSDGLFLDYMDGELHGPEKAEVEAFLEAHPAWRVELGLLDSLSDEVGALPMVKAPTGFAGGVQERIKRDAWGLTAWARVKGLFSFRSAAATGALGTFAVVALVLVIVRNPAAEKMSLDVENSAAPQGAMAPPLADYDFEAPSKAEIALPKRREKADKLSQAMAPGEARGVVEGEAPAKERAKRLETPKGKPREGALGNRATSEERQDAFGGGGGKGTSVPATDLGASSRGVGASPSALSPSPPAPVAESTVVGLPLKGESKNGAGMERSEVFEDLAKAPMVARNQPASAPASVEAKPAPEPVSEGILLRDERAPLGMIEGDAELGSPKPGTKGNQVESETMAPPMGEQIDVATQEEVAVVAKKRSTPGDWFSRNRAAEAPFQRGGPRPSRAQSTQEAAGEVGVGFAPAPGEFAQPQGGLEGGAGEEVAPTDDLFQAIVDQKESPSALGDDRAESLGSGAASGEAEAMERMPWPEPALRLLPGGPLSEADLEGALSSVRVALREGPKDGAAGETLYLLDVPEGAYPALLDALKGKGEVVELAPPGDGPQRLTLSVETPS